MNMKLIYVKRKTKLEPRYHKRMGRLVAKVVYIKKFVLGIPVATLQRYRETYIGEVKSCEDCRVYA